MGIVRRFFNVRWVSHPIEPKKVYYECIVNDQDTNEDELEYERLQIAGEKAESWKSNQAQTIGQNCSKEDSGSMSAQRAKGQEEVGYGKTKPDQ